METIELFARDTYQNSRRKNIEAGLGVDVAKELAMQDYLTVLVRDQRVRDLDADLQRIDDGD